MVLPSLPKFVRNRGHGFSKRLNPAEVHCVCLRYRPAHCLHVALFRGKPAECETATTFTLLKTIQGSSVAVGRAWCLLQSPYPAATYFPNTTILIPVLATISTHAQMESQTRGPSASPPQVSRSTRFHMPTHGCMLYLARRRELALRRRERDNPPHPMWPLIPTFKHFINRHHNFPPSFSFHHLFPTWSNHRLAMHSTKHG